MNIRWKKKRKNFRNLEIDYKNVKTLNHFVTDRYKIMPARISGLSAAQQREIRTAIKRARQLALIPYCTNHKGAVIG